MFYQCRRNSYINCNVSLVFRVFLRYHQIRFLLLKILFKSVLFLEVIDFETLELIISKTLEDSLRTRMPIVLNKYMFLNIKFIHGLLTMSSKVFIPLRVSGEDLQELFFSPRKLEGRIVNS